MDSLKEIKKCEIMFDFSLQIYYGSEFNLKTLSVMALSESECDLWLKGLEYLIEDVRSASYKLHQERWFRKGFYEMETWYVLITCFHENLIFSSYIIVFSRFFFCLF